MRAAFLIAAAALLCAVACSNVGDAPPVSNGGDPLYYPNGDGSTWTYSYQQYFNNVPSGIATEYTETFDGEVVVGGHVAGRLVRLAPGAEDYEILFLADDEESGVLTPGREFYFSGRLVGAVYYDPAWRYLVYPLRVNRSWAEVKQERLSPLCLGLAADVDNDGREDNVDVEIIRNVVTKEDLTIPMGTFTDCYKIRRTIYATFHMTSGGDAEMSYVQYGWFKPNKGFVQYTGDEIYVPNGARYTFLAHLKSYHVVEPEGR